MTCRDGTPAFRNLCQDACITYNHGLFIESPLKEPLFKTRLPMLCVTQINYFNSNQNIVCYVGCRMELRFFFGAGTEVRCGIET